jgi:hypothetical protein
MILDCFGKNLHCDSVARIFYQVGNIDKFFWYDYIWKGIDIQGHNNAPVIGVIGIVVKSIKYQCNDIL